MDFSQGLRGKMKKAELLLISDTIFDSVRDRPFSGGIAISGKRIDFVGSKQTAMQYAGPYTVVKDFGDNLISPGFCDSHVHLEGSVKKDCAVVAKDLDRCTSEEDCVDVVRAFAKEHPELKRINGTNWCLSSWGPGAPPPTKASLDKYFPDIPVYLFGADGHTNWINSKAIEECELSKIIACNPQFPAHYAPRDENGEFTGFLRESPGFLVHHFALNYPPETRAQYHAEYTKLLSSMGITALSEVSMTTPDSIIDQYWTLKAMENSGDLTVRYYLSVTPRGTAPYTTEQIKELDRLKVFFNTDKLRISGIKTILDGWPFAHTSSLLEPYSDNPSTKGDFRFPAEVPLAWFKEANRLGYPVRVHCSGDAAVRLALDCFEESNRVNDNSNIRNTVDHMDCPSDEDIPRFAKLGVIASMQPSHLIMSRGIFSHIYGNRSKNEWCFRKLIDAGAIIAVGTDSPVTDINPYHTIYKAVTRKDLDGTQYSPMTVDQALTLSEVLKGYTLNAAYINGMESKVGTIEAGKYADITVSDKNLYAIPADEIKNCRTVCTVFNGRVVYEE